MYLNDAIKEYTYEIKLRNYSERTIKGYRNNILKFSRYIESELEIRGLEELSPMHIKKYLAYLQQKGLSAVYINSILKNIRSLLKYCQAEGYCSNIATKINLLKEKKVVIETFSDSEVRKMLDVFKMTTYMGARNRCIIAMLFDTGIRNFELCNLTKLDVRETVIYVLGKGNKERVVPPCAKLVVVGNHI